MNRELELVLNTIKTFNEGLKVEDTNVNKLVLYKEDTKVLLDYITNLQEENKRLKKDFISKNNTIMDLHIVLSQRQGKINKALDYINEHTLFVNGGILKSILKGEDNESN